MDEDEKQGLYSSLSDHLVLFFAGGAGREIRKYVEKLKKKKIVFASFLIAFEKGFASWVSGATPWLAPPAIGREQNPALVGVGNLGKSGREISEICSLVILEVQSWATVGKLWNMGGKSWKSGHPSLCKDG